MTSIGLAHDPDSVPSEVGPNPSRELARDLDAGDVRNVPDIIDVVNVAPIAPVMPGTLALPPAADPATAFLNRHKHAPATVATFRKALKAIVQLTAPGTTIETYPWALLTPDHCRMIRSALATHYHAPASTNVALSALRGVLGVAWSEGSMPDGAYKRCIHELPALKGSRAKAGRQLKPEELRALASACDTATAAGSRDMALLALLYGAGMRRVEAVRVQASAFTVDPPTLRVLGKGNIEADVALPPWAALAIAGWIERRGRAPGPIVRSVDRFARIEEKGMTPGALFKLVARIGARAGVKDFSPHDFRRTVITHLLEQGVPITTVQKIARHAAVSTTAGYDRQDERAARRAMQLVGDIRL